jgi:hypothetical protein
MALLRTQKNELFAQATKVGLDPGDFGWREATSRLSPRATISELWHLPSRSYLRFDWTDGGGVNAPTWIFECQPGLHEPTEVRDVTALHLGLQQIVPKWLRTVRAEFEAPDLWSEVAKQRAILASPEVPEDIESKFAESELEHVAQRIEEIRRYVAETSSADSETMDSVNRKLDYLAGAARRLPKFDWRQIAVAVLFQVGWEVFVHGPEFMGFLKFAGSLLFGPSGGQPLLP